jgi:hypothetical protein
MEAASTAAAMNWKKVTWDDISCTEEAVNIINNKDEKIRLKTIFGIGPNKIKSENLRTVCSVINVE